MAFPPQSTPVNVKHSESAVICEIPSERGQIGGGLSCCSHMLDQSSSGCNSFYTLASSWDDTISRTWDDAPKCGGIFPHLRCYSCSKRQVCLRTCIQVNVALAGSLLVSSPALLREIYTSYIWWELYCKNNMTFCFGHLCQLHSEWGGFIYEEIYRLYVSK